MLYSFKSNSSAYKTVDGPKTTFGSSWSPVSDIFTRGITSFTSKAVRRQAASPIGYWSAPRHVKPHVSDGSSGRIPLNGARLNPLMRLSTGKPRKVSGFEPCPLALLKCSLDTKRRKAMPVIFIFVCLIDCFAIASRLQKGSMIKSYATSSLLKKIKKNSRWVLVAWKSQRVECAGNKERTTTDVGPALPLGNRVTTPVCTP